MRDLNTAGVEVEDLRLCPQLHVLADPATVGLLMRSMKVVQAAGFVWLFPRTFASNAFVQIDGCWVGYRLLLSVRYDNTTRVRFSAKLGEEAEEELALA